MRIRRFLVSTAIAACGATAAQGASAQTAVFFDSRESFLAALGVAAPTTQDFSGYAAGANLAGVAVLPGLIAGSSFGTLQARAGADQRMFGFDSTTRLAGGGYYDFVNLGGYTALGFDIAAWDPATSGANVVLSFMSGLPITYALTATNTAETQPVFFGFVSSTPFSSLRLNEPFEVGSSSNEEVAIDNIAAAVTPVPEPETVALMAAGLMALAAKARRRRKAG